MKILCVCNDFYHPGSLVEEGLKFLSDEGYPIDYIVDSSTASHTVLDQYNTLILSKANMTAEDKETAWLNDDWENAIFLFVKKGGALIVIHSGTAGYENNKRLKDLMGGSFAEHPEQCLVTYNPVDGYDETTGVEAFSVMDEHYFMNMDNKNIDLFMTSSSASGTQPAGWLCRSGAGVVTVLTPGHRIEVWQNPNFKQLLRNILKKAENA